MSEERYCIANIIVGGPGAGKSTFLREVLAASSKPKTLVLDMADKDFNDFELIENPELLKHWQKNNKRIKPIRHYQRILQLILGHVRDANIVYEDATAYIPEYIDLDMKELLSMRRHYNLDIYFLFHNFNAVMPKLYQLSTHLTVFRTPEDEDYVKTLRKVPNHKYVMKAVNDIKQKQASEAHLPREKHQYEYLNHTIKLQ